MIVRMAVRNEPFQNYMQFQINAILFSWWIRHLIEGGATLRYAISSVKGGR